MRPGESFIGQPIRSLQTMLRVLAENDSRYSKIIPDGIYGQETMRAVSAFQRLHGLPVTGITDVETWDAIHREYEPAWINIDAAQPVEIILNPGQVIRRGEAHPHVRLVQAILAVLAESYKSISNPGQSGVLDGATSDSLSSFQQLSGLPMTGDLDKRTWKQLALQYPLAANLWITRGGDDSRDYLP